MAREAREISPSGEYLVELRGEELFITKADKEQFIAILEKNFETGKVYDYDLEKDRIGLIVKVGERGISLTMKSITTSYARYFNRTHNRDGKLFIGRFKSNPLVITDEAVDVKAVKMSMTKKTAPKKTVKKEVKQTVKTEEIKEAPKPPVRKNLPSWLL